RVFLEHDPRDGEVDQSRGEEQREQYCDADLPGRASAHIRTDGGTCANEFANRENRVKPACRPERRLVGHALLCVRPRACAVHETSRFLPSVSSGSPSARSCGKPTCPPT